MLSATPGVHCTVTPLLNATLTTCVDNAEYVPKLRLPYWVTPPTTRQPGTMLALT